MILKWNSSLFRLYSLDPKKLSWPSLQRLGAVWDPVALVAIQPLLHWTEAIFSFLKYIFFLPNGVKEEKMFSSQVARGHQHVTLESLWVLPSSWLGRLSQHQPFIGAVREEGLWCSEGSSLSLRLLLQTGVKMSCIIIAHRAHYVIMQSVGFCMHYLLQASQQTYEVGIVHYFADKNIEAKAL